MNASFARELERELLLAKQGHTKEMTEHEIAERLREWAQNEEMIDSHFTAHGCVCNEAADALTRLAAERGEALRRLQDPTVVHVNMLRGIVARITMRQCAHSHGEQMLEWLNAVESANPPPSEYSQQEKP